MRHEFEQGSLSAVDVIRVIRVLEGISQEALARRTGVTRNIVKLIDAGAGNRKISTLEKIAATFDLRVAFVGIDGLLKLFDTRAWSADRRKRRNARSVAPSARPMRTREREREMSLGRCDLSYVLQKPGLKFAMKIRDIGFIAEVIPDGEKIVLVGDWEVEFWVEVLGIRSETWRYFHNAIEVQDFQFLGTPRTALALARVCGASVRLAAVEDEASQITALLTGNRSGRRWSAEFVGGLRGFSHVQLGQVWQSAIPVVLMPGRQTLLRAINLVHSLREQLEFAYGYPLGRRREPNGEYHVVCVNLAIEACRRITLRHLKEGDLSGAIRIVEFVHEVSLLPAALRARIMDGVRVGGAIVESDAFPKEFFRKRLRQLRRVQKRKVYVYRRRFSHLASDRSDTSSSHLLSVGSN